MTESFAAVIAPFGLPPRLAQALLQGLAETGPGEDAVRALRYALERVADAGAARALPDDPLAGTALARITCAAPFLLHHAAAGASRLGPLLAELEAPQPVPWRRYATPEETPALDEAEAMRRVRLWKYDAYLRLTARHLLGRADTRETCCALSDLAEGLVRLALAWSCQQLARSQGLPLCADGRVPGLAVLGMGKLGGRELNYASDIDLILLHDGDDHPVRRAVALPELPIDPGTDDAAYWTRWKQAARLAAGPEEGRITTGEWQQRAGRQMVRLLTTRTGEGIAFRTDVDLRPEGRSGLLVTPLGFALIYYDVQGREWERTALIKARPVAGDPAVAASFLQAIRPFVYRRYLDYSAMEGIALVKHDIDRHHSGALERNLKLGSGGIRENEFFVQALQLLYGGRMPELQVTAHEEAVRVLAKAGLLPAADAAEILADYWLLRERENRVQMVDEQQTQELPEDEEGRLRVFHDFRPGFPQRLAAAEAALAAARQRTALRFRGLFRGMALASGRPAPQAAEWQEALRAHSPPDTVQERLARVDALISKLMRTRIGERCVFKVAGLLTRPEIYVVGTQPAFPRWLEFLEQIGNRNALLTLLEANPPIVPWVSRILAEGGVHAQPLIRHPEFLESYLGGSAGGEQSIRARYQAILEKAADEEDFIVEVQMAKAQAQIQILSLCLNDVEPRVYRRQLSLLADETIRVCLEFAWREMTRRLGVPEGGGEDSAASGFAVLALGKLGTRELHFSSDLDLVFVYGTAGTTSRGKSHYEFHTKLAHKLSNLLTAPTQFGRLYELDHRLRPFGNRGLLVPSLPGFLDFLTQADVWNFQAFTRLRPVAGDGTLAARLAPAIAAAWSRRAPPRREIAREVRAMLERLVAQHAPPPGGAEPRLALKFAVGGMLGFEFLRQFYFLAERAAPGSPWQPPEDTQIIQELLPDYELLNALDERVSFYREAYRHVVDPGDFRRYSAVGARWRFETTAAVCRRMEARIEQAFLRELH
jgi:glutamate-ammonia-ligase adenylyltransferase